MCPGLSTECHDVTCLGSWVHESPEARASEYQGPVTGSLSPVTGSHPTQTNQQHAYWCMRSVCKNLGFRICATVVNESSWSYMDSWLFNRWRWMKMSCLDSILSVCFLHKLSQWTLMSFCFLLILVHHRLAGLRPSRPPWAPALAYPLVNYQTF